MAKSESTKNEKVKKSTASKTKTSTESTTKKSTAKKTSTKKSATKEASARKTSTKKVATKKTTTKKSATNKKPTSRKSSSSAKRVSKKAATNIIEYYDLPATYNQTTVKLLFQTPKKLFVYWEISEADKQNYFDEKGNDFFETTTPYLVVGNKTKNYSFEIEINGIS